MQTVRKVAHALLRAELPDQLPVPLRVLQDAVRRGGTGTLRHLEFGHRGVSQEDRPEHDVGVFVGR